MTDKPLPSGRIVGALLGMLLFLVFATARAEAPMAKSQVPGYYRMMLGQFEVTALYDGYIELDATLLTNAPATDIQTLLARMFIDTPKMQTAVNAFLINTGTNLILVDTGAGKIFGPTLGTLLPHLRAAGYDPAQVDTVLLTHMHGDHLGGLAGDGGTPTFPQADIYVAEKDSSYWLSPAEMAKAPEDGKRFFQIAQDAAAPYIASGKWKTFGDTNLPIPGITAVFIPGHTPGHCGFEITSGTEKLLIIGDVVHSMAVQFARPDVGIVFDTAPTQAISERQALFQKAAQSKALIGGMHIPFPGIGRIRADANNTYTWVPIAFSPLPSPGKTSAVQ